MFLSLRYQDPDIDIIVLPIGADFSFSKVFAIFVHMLFLPKILFTGSLFQANVFILFFGFGVSSWGSLISGAGGGSRGPPGGGEGVHRPWVVEEGEHLLVEVAEEEDLHLEEVEVVGVLRRGVGVVEVVHLQVVVEEVEQVHYSEQVVVEVEQEQVRMH